MHKNNAAAFFSDVSHTAGADIASDPMERRDKHLTMKVNKYDIELLELLAIDARIGKSALIRRLIEDHAKERGFL